MRIEMPGFNKVAICWSRQEIDHALLWLVKLSLTGVESQDRLLIQDCIDEHKFKSSILYDGNTVRPYRKTIEEYKKLLKNWVRSLSNYLYNFFHLQWTIAHYDIQWWIANYPMVDDVKEIVQWGTVPAWKTDVKRIQDWLLSLH